MGSDHGIEKQKARDTEEQRAVMDTVSGKDSGKEFHRFPG